MLLEYYYFIITIHNYAILYDLFSYLYDYHKYFSFEYDFIMSNVIIYVDDIVYLNYMII